MSMFFPPQTVLCNPLRPLYLVPSVGSQCLFLWYCFQCARFSYSAPSVPLQSDLSTIDLTNVGRTLIWAASGRGSGRLCSAVITCISAFSLHGVRRSCSPGTEYEQFKVLSPPSHSLPIVYHACARYMGLYELATQRYPSIVPLTRDFIVA